MDGQVTAEGRAYLNEAHASEVGLVSALQAQIAMTPRGSYRDGLERHLDETREHADRVQRRLGELGQGGNPLQVLLGFTEGTDRSTPTSARTTTAARC